MKTNQTKRNRITQPHKPAKAKQQQHTNKENIKPQRRTRNQINQSHKSAKTEQQQDIY